MLVIIECDTNEVFESAMRDDWAVPHHRDENQVGFEGVKGAYEMVDGRVRVDVTEQAMVTVGEEGTDTPGARIITARS